MIFPRPFENPLLVHDHGKARSFDPSMMSTTSGPVTLHIFDHPEDRHNPCHRISNRNNLFEGILDLFEGLLPVFCQKFGPQSFRLLQCPSCAEAVLPQPAMTSTW